MRSISTEEDKKPVLHPVRCRSSTWVHVDHLPNDAPHVIEKGLLPIPHLFGGHPLLCPFPLCFRPLVNSIRIESGHHLVDDKSKLKDVRGLVRMICGLFPPPLPLFRTYVEMGCQLFAMRCHYGTQATSFDKPRYPPISNPYVVSIEKRSEERRVGKECRTRWVADGEKKKDKR